MKKKAEAPDAIVALIIYFVSIFLATSLGDPLLGSFCFNITTILVLLGYAFFERLDIKKTFSLNLPRPKAFVQVMILWVSSIWILIGLMTAQFELFQAIGLDFTDEIKQLEKSIEKLGAGGNLPLLMLVAVSAPICEEFLFRGIILSGFVNNFKIIRGLLYTTIIFALVHVMIPRFLATFVLGLCFGFVVIYTRSIYLAILFHMLNNATALMLSKMNADVSKFALDPLSIILSVIIFLGTIVWMHKDYKKSLSVNH